MIFGTGGLSHQISGPRAGLINSKWDKAFLDNLSKDPVKLSKIPHLDYMREAGAEGIEMVMWLIMRGALGDKADEVYRFYTVPASNTAVGHIILEPRKSACEVGEAVGASRPPSRQPAKRAAKAQDENPPRGCARQDRVCAGASNEDLRCRAGRVRTKASRCAQAHSRR